MKAIATAAAAVSLAVLPTLAAQAQPAETSRVYGSLGYNHNDLEGADVGSIQGRLGARLLPNFGVEGELGYGVDGDHVNVLGTNVHVKQKLDAAVYGVAALPLSPNFELFARAGYGTTKLKATAGGASVSDDGTSWNFGAGGEYRFDEANGVRLDYTRKEFTGGDARANVWSIGYVRRF